MIWKILIFVALSFCVGVVIAYTLERYENKELLEDK